MGGIGGGTRNVPFLATPHPHARVPCHPRRTERKECNYQKPGPVTRQESG